MDYSHHCTHGTCRMLTAIVLFVTIAHVSSSYPKCQSLSEVQVSWIRTSDDYPHAHAVTHCMDACRGRSDRTTLAGVRRNYAEASFVACYCGDADVSLVSGCSYDCQGDCGGEDAVSVYTVCNPGNYHSDCSVLCPGNCADDVCDIDSGLCNGQCQDQYYGSDCSLTCPNCGADTCSKDTGVCDGGCDPGYYLSWCNETCSPNCSQNSCNIDDGTCDVCKEGWYGPICDSACPRNCDGGCDRSSGDCTKCDAGNYGNKCDIPCPDNCNQTACDLVSGLCNFGCNRGYFCDDCNAQCSTNCHDNTCEFQTGHCSHGCEEGFYGSEFCELICPENCAGNVCDHVDGDCSLGCEAGWSGSRCDNAQTATPVWVWPVLVVMLLAGVAIGFALGAFFWSRRQNSPTHPESSSSSNVENLPHKIYVNETN